MEANHCSEERLCGPTQPNLDDFRYSKEATLTKIGSVRAQNYVRLLPIMRRVPYLELFPGANPLALDLLDKMLTLDPFQRITVNEALNHPYLAIWHDPQDEPECTVKFDFTFKLSMIWTT